MTILSSLVYSPEWFDAFTWLVVVAFIFAFSVSYGMGSNDASNDWGTSVGAGTVKLWQAYLLCSIFNTLGAVLLGYKVTETIRTSIIDVSIYDVYAQYNAVNRTYETVPYCTPTYVAEAQTFRPPTVPENDSEPIVQCARYTGAEFMYAQVGTLLGTSVFLIGSSIFKKTVSATHAIVGATLAASLYLKGNHGIKWMEILGIVSSWFLSPLIAGLVASFIYLLVKYTVLMKRRTFEAALRMCPIFMAATLAINLFACIYGGSKYLGFDRLTWWEAVLVSGAIGIIVGLIIHFPLSKFLRRRAITLYEADKARILKTGNDGNKYAAHGMAAGKKVDVSHIIENGETRMLPAGEIVPPKGPWWKYINKNVPEDPLASKVFNSLQMVSASLLSFSHGANDTSNTVGPLVAIWLTYKTGWALTPAETRTDMQLLLAFGAIAMIAGFVTLGHRVIEMIATDLTAEVSAPSGFTVELGTAFTVLFCAKLGIPVSSTHCVVGAIVFVGVTKSTSEGVNWRTFAKTCFVWLLCFPISASISLACTAFLYNFV